jgi:hypothetical protein
MPDVCLAAPASPTIGQSGSKTSRPRSDTGEAAMAADRQGGYKRPSREPSPLEQGVFLLCVLAHWVIYRP